MDAECPVDNRERVERVRKHFYAYPEKKGMDSVKQKKKKKFFCRFFKNVIRL